MRLRDESGNAILAVYVMAAVLAALTSVFLTRSIQDMRLVRIQTDMTESIYLAETAGERVASELFDAFSDYYEGEGGQLAYAFNWFDGVAASFQEAPEVAAQAYGLTAQGEMADGSYRLVRLSSMNPYGVVERGERLVTLTTEGTRGGVTQRVEMVYWFGLEPSRVFDYAYFINNFGWFYGGGITAHGDVRSNGNFAFRGTPTVNGDVYASENAALGADGTIDGTWHHDALRYYEDHAGDRARPMNPTAEPEDANGNGVLDPGEDRNGNGELDDFAYESGYDGESEDLSGLEPLSMPYLGDLSLYEVIAQQEGGKISQGGVDLVDAVYDGAGPDGVEGTADDGCLVLIGTEDNPVVLDGPVVVRGDVLIKGVVTGQGVIYSGRNVHILGDVTYADPPSWPKPDEDPEGTAEANREKDFLGLIAKGNVVVGDYTRTDWRSSCLSYLRPPFTQAYDTDPTDAPLGYDSDGNPANGYRFDGDYTDYDGGYKTRIVGETVESVPRRYYESSVDDDYFHSIAESSSSIRQVDAVTYTNHAWTGKVGAFTINGSVVARDEAIIYSGSITMVYDVRAHSAGVEHFDFYLPRQLARPVVLSWRQERQQEED